MGPEMAGDFDKIPPLPATAEVPAANVEEARRAVYEGYESFLRREIAERDRRRVSLWHRDFSNATSYEQSVAPMRARLAVMLGFWCPPSERTPVKPDRVEDLGGGEGFASRRWWFEFLPGLRTYAVEMRPAAPGPHPVLLVQHGYSGTPELACGLVAGANEADYSYWSMGLRAVRRGYLVLAVKHPSGFGSLENVVTGHPDFPDMGRCYGKNRLHRLALLAGGTLFGLDMMATSRGLDLALSDPQADATRVGMYGLSQGGQSALFLSALDTRIGASVASAFFNERLPKLIGPHPRPPYIDCGEEDKFFGDITAAFADADIASLICPRAFAVEAGQGDTSVDFASARREWDRLAAHYAALGMPERTAFLGHASGHVAATRRAFDFLATHLGSSTFSGFSDPHEDSTP